MNSLSLSSGLALDGVLQCMFTGFSPGWVDPNVNWLHIRIDPLNQVKMGVHKFSSSDWAVAANEWTTAGGLPNGSVGNICGIWNPKDFVQRPWIEGGKSLSKSFNDWPGFGSVHQQRKNIDFTQPDLRINPDSQLPYILLQQRHIISSNQNPSKNSGLIAAVMSGRGS